MTVAVSTALK